MRYDKTKRVIEHSITLFFLVVPPVIQLIHSFTLKYCKINKLNFIFTIQYQTKLYYNVNLFYLFYLKCQPSFKSYNLSIDF